MAFMITFSRPSEDRPEVETEFNRFYAEWHIPDIFAATGKISSAVRYHLTDAQLGPTPEFSYVTIYRIDSDVAGAVEELRQAKANGRFRSSSAVSGGPVYAVDEIQTFERGQQAE